jgi:hypothetical protein
MPASSAAPSGYELNGLIERVTFFSEESGFCVLRVKADGHRDLVTVVGSAPSVSAGEWITAEGDWVIDKEHGRQLKAFHLKTMPPNTREGMEKYLASGMVKGIGPIYAKRLIARFGEELFEVIEKTPNSLEQIEGIGPKRKLKIVNAWSDQLASGRSCCFCIRMDWARAVLSGFTRPTEWKQLKRSEAILICLRRIFVELVLKRRMKLQPSLVSHAIPDIEHAPASNTFCTKPRKRATALCPIPSCSAKQRSFSTSTLP